MNYKKLLISLGTVMTVGFPVVSVIACSPEAEDHGDDNHDHDHEDHEKEDFSDALIQKLPKSVEISGIDSSSSDAQIKAKIKESLKEEMNKSNDKDVKEALEHLLELDYATATLDKDDKTLTIDAHGKDYVVTYVIK